MGLTNILKINLNQLSVLFPKPPIHTKKEIRERRRGIVSYIGGYSDGNSSLYGSKYITSEDIDKMRQELAI